MKKIKTLVSSALLVGTLSSIVLTPISVHASPLQDSTYELLSNSTLENQSIDFLTEMLNSEVSVTEFMESYIQELPSENKYIENYEVTDEFGEKHFLSINRENNEMTIDGETIVPEITEASPLLDYGIEAFATIDTSTGRTYGSVIPWKQTVTLTVAAILTFVAGIPNTASFIASLIVELLTESAPDFYYSYTQYNSKESYYSSYYNTYYKKAINQSFRIRQNSSTGKLLYGPTNGNWFDPIRPYGEVFNEAR